MKKVFELTNRYIIVATPLLLFILLVSIYSVFVFHTSEILKLIFGIVLMFLMFSAFLSGWGNMLKSAISENNYDEPFKIIKDFAPGVGEFFVPVMGMIAISFLISALILTGTYFCGMHFIGDLGISQTALTNAMANQEALKTFLTSLSTEQLLKLNMWNILVLSVMSLLYFLFMLYSPALILESKNPFKALYISLKHLFGRNFFQNFGIYLIIISLHFLISIISALTSGTTILSFVISLINFYFVCCVAIAIFYYYDKKFLNPHLGNNIDTYI